MDLKLTIIIAAMQRANLLKWNLYSLAQQDIPFTFETIVLNDGIPDDTENICKEYEDRLNLKYIFTGHRNLGGEITWRVPGFAFNIGAKLSGAEILILSCAEMFHINDSITRLTNPLLADHKLLAMPIGMADQDGSFLKYVIDTGGNIAVETMPTEYPTLNTFLPFLLSISRAEFMAIGGYDEDFTGISFDDNDLVERLLKNGCTHCRTEAKTVHLYHQLNNFQGKNMYESISFNERLYLERRDQIIRNQNREWGIL
jgi:glycosyltransferase involved in cell wall biosynthesis